MADNLLVQIGILAAFVLACLVFCQRMLAARKSTFLLDLHCFKIPERSVSSFLCKPRGMFCSSETWCIKVKHFIAVSALQAPSTIVLNCMGLLIVRLFGALNSEVLCRLKRSRKELTDAMRRRAVSLSLDLPSCSQTLQAQNLQYMSASVLEKE